MKTMCDLKEVWRRRAKQGDLKLVIPREKNGSRDSYYIVEIGEHYSENPKDK